MRNDFRASAVALLQGFDLALNEVQFAGEGLDNKHYLVLRGKSPAIRVQEHVDSFTLYTRGNVKEFGLPLRNRFLHFLQRWREMVDPLAHYFDGY